MIRLLSKNQRKKILFFGALTALLAILFFIPQIALAQGAPTDPEMTKLMNDIMLKVNMILDFLSPVAWMIIYMVGGLFDNELIFGGNMGEALLNVWVQVRNIVNVFFVLILIIIAIYNVLGLGDKGPFQNLQLKQILPKFVISLLIVNFSFLGAKVFIDFTNVITQAVFALPSNITSVDTGKIAAEFCGPKAPFLGYFCDPQANGTYAPNERAKQFFAKLDSRNLALAMAIDFGKLHQQKLVAGNVKDVWQLVFNILFGIVINVMYIICFAAVLIVLIARIAVLWVCVALSPLLALSIVFPNIMQTGGGEMDIGKNIVKHTTAPIIIGVFMSIGYIMMDTLNKFPSISNGYFSSLQMDMLDPNALTTGIANVQQFLIAVATVYLVFTGVFAAAGETVAKGITNSIKDTTLAVGKFFGKLPLYAQIAPVAGAEGVTPMQLISTLKGLEGHLHTARGRDLLEGDPNVRRITAAGDKGSFYNEIAKTPGALKSSAVQERAKAILKEEGVSEEELEDIPKAVFDHAPAKFKDDLGGSVAGLRSKMSAYEEGAGGLFGPARAAKPAEKGEKINKADYDKRNSAIREGKPSTENRDKELSGDNKGRLGRLDANIRANFEFVNGNRPDFDETTVGRKLDAVEELSAMMKNSASFDSARAQKAFDDLYQPELLKTIFASPLLTDEQRKAIKENDKFAGFLRTKGVNVDAGGIQAAPQAPAAP